MFDLRFDTFSGKEAQIYQNFSAKKDELLRPFCRFLKSLRLTADQVTYAGLLMSFIFVAFLQINQWLSLLALILNFLLDGLDGTYARFLGPVQKKGNLLDHVMDLLGFLVIMLGLFWHHFFDPFWGALYLLNYVIMSALLMTLGSLRLDVPFVLKSKYIFELFFLMMVVSGLNLFNPFLVFFSIYMVITNIVLFYKLRCSL